jgi:GNAT superfamily N-acetyltransferase
MKYYGEHYCFKPVFEYYVIKGITEFLHDPSGSNLWIAEVDGLIVGSIAIVKTQNAAQLRWFLVDKEYQGIGIGRNLMKTALRFCEEQKYNRVFLWTGNILKVARHLYKEFGFYLTEENSNNEWTDGTITEEQWELNL